MAVAFAAAIALSFLADLVSIRDSIRIHHRFQAVAVTGISDPTTPRPFRAPWIPFVSTMGVLVNGFMMFSLGKENWIRLAIWLVIGMMIYFGYSRRHSLLRRGAGESHAAPVE